MATKTKKSSPAAKPARTTKPASAARPRTQSAPRIEKPVFRPVTLIVVLVFAAIIAAAIYMNQQADTTAEAETTPAAEEAFLFPDAPVVNSIEVKPLEGTTVKLERNESQAWVLSQPDEVEADQGLSEAAASQIAALRIVTEIDGSKDPSIFGFDEPAYTLTIGFEGGVENTLEIGDTTPSNTGYYVRMDGNKFYVVTLSGISALTNLVTAPPYLSTPTPVPTATSTPLPTATPEATTEATTTP